MKKLLGISGSARKGSFNTALLKALSSVLPPGIGMDIIAYADIPLYNQDLEAEFPHVVADLKEKIRAADGIVISTPEYNRSVPGYLKNMLDWTSRPYGDNAWKGKPVLVMGASGAAIGTALAQYDLKKILLYLDAKLMGQPETYVGFAKDKFALDALGGAPEMLTDEDTKSHLAKAAAAFAAMR